MGWKNNTKTRRMRRKSHARCRMQRAYRAQKILCGEYFVVATISSWPLETLEEAVERLRRDNPDVTVHVNIEAGRPVVTVMKMKKTIGTIKVEVRV